MPHPLVAPVVAWFDAHGRDLPWRAPGCSPWGVLVSEVMLQQTPVSRVEPVWSAWLERWPHPSDLAGAPTADVLRAWGRLGYPRRALRLQQCAVAVVDRHGGAVPTDEASLLALPGVGTYTAAAVLAFAYGRRSVVVDTNVRRVLARAVDGTALPGPHLSTAELGRAARLVPEDEATSTRWNAGVMELGALVCTARAPRCEACPVGALCAWRTAGMPDDAPVERRRQSWHGTDRQARGLVMAALRAAAAPVPDDEVAAVLRTGWPAAQDRTRVLAGLVADGLVEPVGGADGTRAYRFPGSAP
ncbi:MAG TPA: A/G-specific adenine glycosylase [Actinotalea sp.]|nr:A/G-specific adenine glycosylase [Actinotalea sp.]